MEKLHRSQFETSIVEAMPKLATYSTSAFFLGSFLECTLPRADDKKNVVYTFIEVVVSFLIITICLISLTLFASGPGSSGLLVYIIILFAIQDNLIEKIKLVSEKFVGIFSDERPFVKEKYEKNENYTTPVTQKVTQNVTQEDVSEFQTSSIESSTEKGNQQITPVLKPKEIPIDKYYQDQYNQNDTGSTSLSALF